MWDIIKWIFKLLQDKVQMCIVRMSAIYIKSNVMSQSFLVKRLDKKMYCVPVLDISKSKDDIKEIFNNGKLLGT